MKKLILLLTLIFRVAQAQGFTGKWNGMLSVQGMGLRLIFQIIHFDLIYQIKVDSPNQNTFGIPASAATFRNATLHPVLFNLRPVNLLKRTLYPAGWLLAQK